MASGTPGPYSPWPDGVVPSPNRSGPGPGISGPGLFRRFRRYRHHARPRLFLARRRPGVCHEPDPFGSTPAVLGKRIIPSRRSRALLVCRRDCRKQFRHFWCARSVPCSYVWGYASERPTPVANEELTSLESAGIVVISRKIHRRSIASSRCECKSGIAQRAVAITPPHPKPPSGRGGLASDGKSNIRSRARIDDSSRTGRWRSPRGDRW